ncbi:MAG TPA: hypothetical protein QGI07_02310 [Dehalococcoidia bacterium]|nr:hypothetical protein [Dehalococcoidia bacterium]MDP6274451.1 hypothetical protein [Dehalococcoidia bacterium]MDP7213553.1 hypothetical protein [Dehalococcoidia bacterium]HJM52844.1 hypothetical protein [Dehalococcoidia bacterium]
MVDVLDVLIEENIRVGDSGLLVDVFHPGKIDTLGQALLFFAVRVMVHQKPGRYEGPLRRQDGGARRDPHSGRAPRDDRGVLTGVTRHTNISI